MLRAEIDEAKRSKGELRDGAQHFVVLLHQISGEVSCAHFSPI